MMMHFPSHVKIVEVSPRDGLQNEKQILPTATKIAFINQLSLTGLSVIEVSSFVSARWVPQLADAREVLLGIDKNPLIRYPVLVPNQKGLVSALEAGAADVAVFVSPSESFSQHNTNCSVSESLERIGVVLSEAKMLKIRVRAYVSCVLGCPYEGEMPMEKVVSLVSRLREMGCEEISLGDTIGVGTPLKTQQLLMRLCDVMPLSAIAVHFHDTYGQALANILAALSCGVAIIDSSVGGIGGCPYAKGASGNVATEDVLYMLQGMGIQTGVDLNKVIIAGRFITQALGKTSQSKVSLANATKVF
ncbi:MAG TPA: hydroxymethylglutaryl-CoA lyase [Gammaproteobacteria bacterium]|nr:hydroxymethylglutaryl-CoA lyase [Gammaproteobacteria bacterium]